MKAKGIKMVFLGIVVIAIFGAVVMILWNILMPGIFGLASINFWQALGLFVLARIFFGGFGGRRMMHGRMHGRGENPIHKKWMKMTPEQRREFVVRRRQFGFDDFIGKDKFDNDEHEGPGK